MNSTYLTLASTERNAWLCRATEAVKCKFEGIGIQVPDTIRISIGIPRRRKGAAYDAIGQCWKRCMTKDGFNEIFISPELSEESQILGVIAHEMVHAIDDCEHGHGKVFKQMAIAIGLTGKMTATTETEAFKEWSKGVVETIGKYPAGALFNPPDLVIKPKRESVPRAKTIKFGCDDCDYECRVPEPCVEANGQPICPGCRCHMQPKLGKKGGK